MSQCARGGPVFLPFHMCPEEGWNSGLSSRKHIRSHPPRAKQDTFKGNADARGSFMRTSTRHAEFGRLQYYKILSQKEQECYCFNPVCGNSLLNLDTPLPKLFIRELILSNTHTLLLNHRSGMGN